MIARLAQARTHQRSVIPAGITALVLGALSAPAVAWCDMVFKDVVATAHVVLIAQFLKQGKQTPTLKVVEVLKGDGPFTVFAPTDEAFAKLPKGTIEALLQDKEKLTAVLTYHVVPGKVMAADVAGLSSAKTVQGQELKIDTSDGVKVDNAKVIKTDISASNGVIHVIDTVLMPK